MKRKILTPQTGNSDTKRLVSIILIYHHWMAQFTGQKEFIQFTLKQIEQLEDAANELHQMCLAVTNDLIQRG